MPSKEHKARSVQSSLTRAKPSKKVRPEFVLALLGFLAAGFLISSHKIIDHNEEQKNVVQPTLVAKKVPVRIVAVESLPNEDSFLATIKSCMPETNKNCKTFIPEHTTTERVALLAPPGDMTEAFFRLLHVVVERAKKKNKAVDIQLIKTTHMAPYGYGKTHGWTRIIRLVPRPLVLGAVNTLQGSIKKRDDEITVDDIKSSLRQQIRYHCRLNHIAAHTSLWSLNLEQMKNQPLEELTNEIQRFLGLEQVNIMSEMEESHEAVTNDDLIPPSNSEQLFNTMATAGSIMLSQAQAQMQDDILKELDDVLVEELRISKNLSAWPCESFWTVGDPSKEITSISPIISRISKAISPNCTAPFTSCFVQRDKCEFKGDGKCES